MSTWAAVATGGIISVASVIAGVLLQWKLSQKQLDRDRAAERTERVASVLGRMRPLLAHLLPERIATATPFIVRSFYENPWTPIQADLGALIASEPESALREDLVRLENAVVTLFSNLVLLVDADLQQRLSVAGRTRVNMYEDAVAQHTEVETLLGRILDELHGSPSGDGVRSSRTAPG